MNLLTLGDSFTYGEELDDRTAAWPQLVANTIEYDLINLGEPANSNPGICRQLIDHFSAGIEDKPNLVIVAWSSPGRMEFSDITGHFSIWPGYSGRVWQENCPWRDTLLSYINQYHNDEYIYVKYLQDVILVQSFLQSQGVDYLMLNTVANEYYKNNFGKKYSYYEKLIDTTKFIGWPHYGMAEWTIRCPRGPGGHFLEKGHQQVAEKINEHIRNLGRLS